MKRQSRYTMEGTAKQRGLLALMSVVLAACGGGQDGVSIGSGQEPDPAVIDFPIAYIRAPVPTDDNGQFEQRDLREQITFDFGADLFYRDRASPSAEAINITAELTQGLAAIRDVEIAYDGSSLLFAMRFPFDPNLDEDDLPTWNIWQYTFETDTLERVISSNLTAEIGHDIMPKYLPDGRIIFASTRQTQSQGVLIDEGKGGFVALDENRNEFAFTLHVMSSDGLTVEQVTYNQSHDLDPSVLANGQIVFSRWDHVGPNNEVNLYRMNPDGSGLELLYGAQSHATGTNGSIIQFMQPRELEDGRIMTLVRPFDDTEDGGELIMIDTSRYLENTQPTKDNIGLLSGPAQEDATVNDVRTESGVPSPGGRYGSVYPILDGTGRLLVSFSQCRLVEQLEDDGDPNTEDTRIVPCTEARLANLFVQPDPDNPVAPAAGSFVVAPPLYGIWMYDPRDDTQQPVVPGEEGFMITEVVAADPRIAPPVVLDGANNYALDPTLIDAAEGVLNIRSVYDRDGAAILDIPTLADPSLTPAETRPARFLRIEKAVSIPDEDATGIALDNTDFGISTRQGMREIVGYAMIEPDGSVMTRVPANVALAISVVDANGKRITGRHQAWLQARPGEEVRCNGCHVRDAQDPVTLEPVSHGRADAFESDYAGAPAGMLTFPNTNPAWFIGEPGQTMAEVRASITCSTDNCSSLEPSMNVMYRDVWTDPLSGTPSADIDYLYTDLATASPASLACQDDWQALCRSVINYLEHIQPLWDVSRPAVDPATGLQVDNQCTVCHTFPYIDPVTAQLAPPPGQLELTSQPSLEEPDHVHSYRELLVTDNLQEVVGGQLVDVLEPTGEFDIDGNPISDVVPIGSPASIAGATASAAFFSVFEDPAHSHYNMLSGAERRLIAEWLDVGAQYYNNPFDVPQ